MWEGARTRQVQLRWTQADGAGENNVKLPQKLVRSLSNSSSCCVCFFSLPSQTAPTESQVLRFPSGKATVRGWEALAALLKKLRCCRPRGAADPNPFFCPAWRCQALDPSRAQTCSGLVPAASRALGSSWMGEKQRGRCKLKITKERPRSTTALLPSPLGRAELTQGCPARAGGCGEPSLVGGPHSPLPHRSALRVPRGTAGLSEANQRL